MGTLSFRKPSAESLPIFLAAQAKQNFTYIGVGTTATNPPTGYVVDRTRVQLGEGEAVFLTAQKALQRWQQFQLGWVEAAPRDTPIVVGEVIGVMARSFGMWWLNCCRIVYTVDDSGPISRFGFAYGTLPAHVESGEERFLIEWNRSDNTVWYDIIAFSKPNHILTRIGYPLVRREQKRFARDSAAAMLKAVRLEHPGARVATT